MLQVMDKSYKRGHKADCLSSSSSAMDFLLWVIDNY